MRWRYIKAEDPLSMVIHNVFQLAEVNRRTLEYMLRATGPETALTVRRIVQACTSMATPHLPASFNYDQTLPVFVLYFPMKL